MKKNITFGNIGLIFFSGIIFLSFLIFPRSISADNSTIPGQSVHVSATLGSYYLTLSGYIAPYASVVLLGNDFALKSAVADANGYFTIDKVIVERGATNFCLDAIDVKRLGESYTCLNLPPIMADYEKKNIFLPPTLGVQRSQINVGENAQVWGYSMPGAHVNVYLSDGRTVAVTADKTGFYQVKVKMDKAGQYELFADATFQNTTSLKPDRTTSLIALSTGQQITRVGENTLNTIKKFLTGSPWAILLLIVPLLALIVWLLRKVYPRLVPVIREEFGDFAQHVPFVPHRLHHWWMKDVGF